MKLFKGKLLSLFPILVRDFRLIFTFATCSTFQPQSSNLELDVDRYDFLVMNSPRQIEKNIIDRISIRTHGTSRNDVTVTRNDQLLKGYMLSHPHLPTGIAWCGNCSPVIITINKCIYIIIHIYIYIYVSPWKYILCIVPCQVEEHLFNHALNVPITHQHHGSIC